MRDQDIIEEPALLCCPQHMPTRLPGGFDGVEPYEPRQRMSEYPEGSDLAWSVIETFIACAIAGLLCVCVYFALYFASILLGGVK